MTQVIAGIHAVKHALETGQSESGDSMDELLIEKGKKHPRINELIHLAKKTGIRFSFVPRQALDRHAEGVPHQG
ncbi:MAG: RNA methyltransferase substrate-binding domain-containing protein, partial [Mariprofundaceae bacterium]